MNYLDIYTEYDPEWINAPEWANWRTVDHDGTITHFENEPEAPDPLDYNQWVWSSGMWKMHDLSVGMGVRIPDWHMSLQWRSK